MVGRVMENGLTFLRSRLNYRFLEKIIGTMLIYTRILTFNGNRQYCKISKCPIVLTYLVYNGLSKVNRSQIAIGHFSKL